MIAVSKKKRTFAIREWTILQMLFCKKGLWVC